MRMEYCGMLLAITAGIVTISGSMAGRAAQDAVDGRQSAGRDWPNTGGGLHDTRYSALAQIDTKNVGKLGASWVSRNYDDGATSRATPVAKDGMLFITAGDRVYALNAKTGERVWTFQTTTVQESGPIATRGGIPNGEGVGVGEGLVFVGLMDGSGIALDEMTGKLVWNHDLRDVPKTAQYLYASPIYSDGVLFWGLERAPRYVGRAVALDAKTGRELWRFNTVPGPGEPGHETWPQNTDAWKRGAASIWRPPAVDPDLGLVYYGTSNAEPVYSGEVRAGDNLYTCSVIALDIKTGKLRWYYQFVHHDVWEEDVATPVVLYDVNINGRTRKGIGAMRPDGYLFLLDRETGKPLIPIKERPVPQDEFAKTAATQPFPEGDSILRPCSEWKDKIPDGFVVGCYKAPSSKGQNVLTYGVDGARLVPMSYSPQTGYFYAQAKDQLLWFRRGDDPLMHQFGVHAAYNIDKYAYSVLAAIDSRTNKIAWKKIVPLTNNFGPGGWLTTAGGLAFHRMGDGNFSAFDAKTGDTLWQFQTGHPAGDSSPITYEVEGQQYVAISAANAIWAFALGGTVPPATAPPPPPPYEAFTGPIENTTVIETASLLQTSERGTRYWVDRTAFHPYRARITAGTPLTFSNNGLEDHTIVALDGSWTTGLLHQAETITRSFDKPGTYAYRCKEHPWSYGQIIVIANVPKPSASGTAQPAVRAQAAGGFAAQSENGKAAYVQSCSACHMSNLSGNGEAAPALAGNEFAGRWTGHDAGELLDKIRTTMPVGAAGTLSSETYRDIVAYILDINEYEATKESFSEASLRKLRMAKN